VTRVIKVGGRPQADPDLPRLLAQRHHHHRGELVVVHGGGDEISDLQKHYGITPQFIDGWRVTSAQDINIVRMVLSGIANKRIVGVLNACGVNAVGVSGEDNRLIEAHFVDEAKYGAVGRPKRINTDFLRLLMGNGMLPVVSPVSFNSANDGTALNVNGDEAAAAIAVALGAEELLLVSDVEGVLANGEAVKELDQESAQQLIEDGTAQGGMGAKLRAAINALEGGVEKVRISDVRAIEHLDRGTILTRVGSTVQ
jgi:acetylglutamate kinase